MATRLSIVSPNRPDYIAVWMPQAPTYGPHVGEEWEMKLPTVRRSRDGSRGSSRGLALFGFAAATVTAAAMAASPAAAAPVDGQIRDAGTAEVVADSYVVVLKPGSTDVGASARSLTGRYGGSVGHTYTK